MKKLILMAVLAFSFIQANSQEFNHLCSGGESVLLSAKLKAIKRGKTSNAEVETGKYVSLCGNSVKEPIEVVRYRFGMPGNIELEKEFNKNNPLALYPHINHPGVSNLMQFKIGSYTYQLDRFYGGGGAWGVSLTVLLNSKEVAEFIARNEEVNSPIDKFLDSIDIQNIRSKTSSPAFLVRKFDY